MSAVSAKSRRQQALNEELKSATSVGLKAFSKSVLSACLLLLRDTAVKLLDLEDAVKANQKETHELIQKVAVLTKGILAQSIGGAVEADEKIDGALKTLNSVVEEIYDCVKTRFKGCGVLERLHWTVRNSELTQDLQRLSRRLDDAYARYHVELTRHQTELTRGLMESVQELSITNGVCSSVGLEPAQNVFKQPQTTLSMLSSVSQTSLLTLDLPPKPRIVHGRHDDIEIIIAHLAQASALLSPHIAILGPGGIGKTTVALTVIHDSRVETKYENRRIFVKCEGVTSADGLIAALGAALRLSAAEDVSMMSCVQYRLRDMRPCCLLVLDNLESAWDTSDQARVEELLTHLCNIDSVALMVTMRGTQTPMGQDWISLSPLQPLKLEDSRRVFLQICDRDGSELDELLLVLDGLPLAIMIIASIGRTGYTPSELLKSYVQEKTDMIKTGREHRLTNLAISIEVSLRCQTMVENPDALELLMLLSLLPDGIQDEDLAAIFPTMRRVAANARILQQVALCSRSSGWTRSLAPIRLYIEHQYPPQGAHLDELYRYYIQLALESEGAGKTLPLVSINRLSRQIGNTQAVLFHALNNAEDISSVLRAIAAFGWFQQYTFLADRKLLLWAVHNKYRTSPPTDRAARIQAAECTCRLADTLYVEGDLEQAEVLLNDASSTFQVADHALGMARCTQTLGSIRQMQGRYEEALVLLTKALAQVRKLQDVGSIASCSRGLSKVHLMQGHHESATALLEDAKAMYEKTGNRFGVAQCLERLGHVHVMQKEPIRAAFYLTEAKQEFHELGNRLGVAQCNMILATCRHSTAERDEAIRLLTDAKTTLRNMGHRKGLASCTALLGYAWCAKDNIDEACAAFKEAEQAWMELGESERAQRAKEGRGRLQDARSKGWALQGGSFVSVDKLRTEEN